MFLQEDDGEKQLFGQPSKKLVIGGLVRVKISGRYQCARWELLDPEHNCDEPCFLCALIGYQLDGDGKVGVAEGSRILDPKQKAGLFGSLQAKDPRLVRLSLQELGAQTGRDRRKGNFRTHGQTLLDGRRWCQRSVGIVGTDRI
jgi:hypothetical protein